MGRSIRIYMLLTRLRHLMDNVLRGLLWDHCMCYLDDIIVYGDSFFKTLANLEMVFQHVRASGLRLKPSKYKLFKQELLYLGFLINADGFRLDPAKIEVERDWPTPYVISATYMLSSVFATIIGNSYVTMRQSQCL